ncbi:MAG: hypothetical protein AAGA18_14080 [Verrucomicrobiota bacterium]
MKILKPVFPSCRNDEASVCWGMRNATKSSLAAITLIYLTVIAPLGLDHIQAQTTSGTTSEDENISDQANKTNIWQASLTSGSYSVRLTMVASVSEHEYVVDGAMKVNEVTIDTAGSVTARFYFIEPYTPNSPSNALDNSLEQIKDRSRQVMERLGQTELIENTVVKNYPTTTHAKTVEFRLSSQEELQALYRSIQSAFRSGKGRAFTIATE